MDYTIIITYYKNKNTKKYKIVSGKNINLAHKI